MATYRREQINIANWISYLTGLDNRITQSGDNAVSIDGKFVLSFPMYNNNSDRRYMQITVNGVDHKSANWFSNFTTPFFQSFIGEKIIVLRTIPSNYTDNNHGFEMIYFKDEVDNYYAGIYDTTSSFELSNTNLYKVTEGSTPFKFKNVLTFKMPAGQIAFCPTTPFLSGNDAAGFCPELFSCSNVTVTNSIALPNGNNYYALGSNIMIQVN